MSSIKDVLDKPELGSKLENHIDRNTDQLIRDQMVMKNEISSVNSRLAGTVSNQGWIIKIGATIIGAFATGLFYLTLELSSIKSQYAGLAEKTEDVSKDLSAHKTNPNLHTGGINNLKDYIDKYFTKKEELDRAFNGVEKEIEQVGKRIDRNSDDIGLLIEGQVEANAASKLQE